MRSITIKFAITLVCVLSDLLPVAFGTPSDTSTTTTTTTNDCVVNVDGTTTCQRQGGPPQPQPQPQSKRRQHKFKYLKHCHDARSDCELLLQNEFHSKEDDYVEACITNFDVMSTQCAKTCRFCSTRDPNPRTIASHKPVTVDRIFSLNGAPQVLEGTTSIDAWLHVRTMEEYMYNIVYNTGNETTTDDDPYRDVRIQCQLRHERCTQWAVQGECVKNPSYMTTVCAPACMSCRKIRYEYRCPSSSWNESDAPTTTALAQPGDLYNLFHRVMTDPQFAVYRPRAISQPTNDTAEDAPWIVVLEDVLSPTECESVIKLAHQQGFKQSGETANNDNNNTKTATTRFDGSKDTVRSNRRTSSTTWCRGTCHESAIIQSIHQRIENLLGIPQTNYEYLQLLKYEIGEKYVQHHDYLHHQLHRDPGVRMLTVYMYLNDVVSDTTSGSTTTGGGDTHFHDLGLSVQPKRGRVVIWPSVLDHNTSQIDARTHHEALPVEQGTKYGANAWIHQRDYKTPYQKGCAN